MYFINCSHFLLSSSWAGKWQNECLMDIFYSDLFKLHGTQHCGILKRRGLDPDMVSWQGVTSRLKRSGGHKLRSREKFSKGYLKLWKLEFHSFLSGMIWNKHHKFSDYSHRDQSILLHMNWSTVLKGDGVIHEGRKMDWRGQRQRWRRKSIFEQKKTQW